MQLRWYSIVVDCHHVQAQAGWWAEVLDWQVIYDTPEEAVILPKHVSDAPPEPADWAKVGPGLVFVPVPEAKQVKNRLHLDLAPHTSDDRNAQIQRLLALGATKVNVGQNETEVSWTVMADPEGNEFCVLSSRNL